jgi:hypothetical protein
MLPSAVSDFMMRVEERMAEKVEKCGAKTIRYPSECSYSCVCPPGNFPCTWTVTCDGNPPVVFTGTGLVKEGQPAKPPHATVDGAIGDIANMLQVAWQRRVIVPPGLRGRKIRKRTLKGTPEQIAAALGLQLGSKIKRKVRPPTGDYVWIKG